MRRKDVRGTALDLLSDAGLTTLPIDVEAFARYLGIRIHRLHDLDGRLAGFLHRGRDWDNIVINGSHGPARQRFTIAHEIGHWWLDPPGATLRVDEDMYLDPDWEQECEVNTFAAELLMPELPLRDEWERDSDRESLCRRFRVSRRAMARRLHELGLNGAVRFEP